jgi:hypothetical protein
MAVGGMRRRSYSTAEPLNAGYVEATLSYERTAVGRIAPHREWAKAFG